MSHASRFSLHPQSTLLRPDAPGLAALMDALSAGQSIHARQSGPAITAHEEQTQKLYCQSSGTTGTPKTVRRAPATWIASFEQHRTRFGTKPGDVQATLGALGHSLSLFASIEALHLGAGLLPLHGLGAKRQARALQESRTTVLYATPAQLRLLVQGCKAAEIGQLPALRQLLCGGGALEPCSRPVLRRLFPNAQLRVFYGASETSFITMEEDGTPEGSVGRAYPGVKIEIRQEGKPVGPGETGEVWVKSLYLFEGYETGDSPETRRDGAYLTVGELGYLDVEGHLFLAGRAARVVQVADTTVSLDHVEAVIGAQPGVRQCAALARPDALRGTAITCVVEAEGGTGLQARLRAACAAQLGQAATPRRVIVIPAMPLLPAGKPDLRALTEKLDAAG
jgi:long-chain acyl-CoA synthetase